tara:strand:+ start:1413 stop:2525 length:1113 start_codon:yes stop_codon:yes gene_type:complete
MKTQINKTINKTRNKRINKTRNKRINKRINKTRNKRINKTKKNTQYLPMNHINKIVYKASKKDYVLLGESTHGTREFYNTRLNITKRLINNYKFNTVFLETEWSLGYKLNKYIHSKLKINAETLLEETFVKFPKWMTCNKYIVKLLDFMKKYNTKNTRKVYLYGIDCQDVELAKANVCSEPDLNCPIVTEIIKNYEIMKQSNYWNARDSFWLKIIKRVAKYRKSKFILWAHNSHIGDVTANIRQQYKINIGYLLKKIYNVYLMGFSTAIGEVTAAKTWGGKGETMLINPPIKNSFEAEFNEVAKHNNRKSFIYVCNKNLNTIKYFRYIGVIYNKANEMASHYVKTNINKEFDVIFFFRKTRALDNCNLNN